MASLFVRRLANLLRSGFLRVTGRPRMRGLRGVGEAWEDLAAKHLERAGYRILERNFRAKPGEIDFVAKDGDVICFIEVKGRRGLRFGRPAEAVGPEKQRRIFRAALAVWQMAIAAGKDIGLAAMRHDVRHGWMIARKPIGGVKAVGDLGVREGQ